MQKKKFEDPLKNLNITYRRGKDLEEWARFESTFKAYNIKLRQLFIIYDRHCDRFPSYHKNMEYSRRLIEATKKGEILKLTEQESNEFDKTRKDMILCEIDYEDFFIHGRILMDFITRLMPFFFNQDIVFSNRYYSGLPEIYTSFEKHKKWFKQTKISKGYPSHNHIPGEYREYITEKTEWFNDLRYFRDRYLVHPLYFGSRGFMTKKESNTTMPIFFHAKGGYKTPVMELPDIEKIMNNIIDFLNFLNDFLKYFLTGTRYITIAEWKTDRDIEDTLYNY